MADDATAATILAGLWGRVGGDPAALGRATLGGDERVLPSEYRVGAAAMATIAATGLAASELWRLRTGRAQAVTVDARAAAIAFRSERYLSLEGVPPGQQWDPLAGFYRAGDGRFIQLHTNFPHHRAGVLAVLGAEGRREAVAAAIAGWRADALEDALAAAGMCAGMVRRPEEWQAHPQGAAVASLPVLEITRIGDAPPEPAGDGARPLGGVRVLDLTRVIAGPICGRTLAEHGADVLLISAAHLPQMETVMIDTGRGKRSARLDLREAGDAARLRELVRDADVFVQSYRPGALAARGFAPEALAALRPGLVYVTLSAYGHAGPWAGRRGFDSLVQSVSGIAHEGGRVAGVDEPRHLPCQAIDHATGYLAALGAMTALARRAREGGSWLVRLSLAQTARWFTGLGRLPGGAAVPDPRRADVLDLLETTDTPFGRLHAVRPAARLSETPPRWALPAVPLGTHQPEWGQTSKP
jgi:crotonobetainyl-CoA:carnitine CoA-transferase CaiB-like acyl-CoA transferase